MMKVSALTHKFSSIKVNKETVPYPLVWSNTISMSRTNNCGHSAYSGEAATVYGSEEDLETESFEQTLLQTCQSLHWYVCRISKGTADLNGDSMLQRTLISILTMSCVTRCGCGIYTEPNEGKLMIFPQA